MKAFGRAIWLRLVVANYVAAYMVANNDQNTVTPYFTENPTCIAAVETARRTATVTESTATITVYETTISAGPTDPCTLTAIVNYCNGQPLVGPPGAWSWSAPSGFSDSLTCTPTTSTFTSTTTITRKKEPTTTITEPTLLLGLNPAMVTQTVDVCSGKVMQDGQVIQDPISQDATNDSDGNASDDESDTASDAGNDDNSDTASDAGSDTGSSTGADDNSDTASDAGSDAGTSNDSDIASDAGSEAGDNDDSSDAGSDAGSDSGSNAGTDENSDTASNTGSDTGSDDESSDGSGGGSSSFLYDAMANSAGFGTSTQINYNIPPMTNAGTSTSTQPNYNIPPMTNAGMSTSTQVDYNIPPMTNAGISSSTQPDYNVPPMTNGGMDTSTQANFNIPPMTNVDSSTQINYNMPSMANAGVGTSTQVNYDMPPMTSAGIGTSTQVNYNMPPMTNAGMGTSTQGNYNMAPMTSAGIGNSAGPSYNFAPTTNLVSSTSGSASFDFSTEPTYLAVVSMSASSSGASSSGSWEVGAQANTLQAPMSTSMPSQAYSRHWNSSHTRSWNGTGQGRWNGTAHTRTGNSTMSRTKYHWSGASPTSAAGLVDGTKSIISTVNSWTIAAPASTYQASAAPTYTNAPASPDQNIGEQGSNVTVPGYGGANDTLCNDASDRSQWCDGRNLLTNYYTDNYDTGNICSYDFTITNTTLNFDGDDRLAFAINGQVPGPLIECNWGDTIQVTVTNQLQDNATTIHWHGMNQQGTNDQDGVPGISECAIAPGQSRMYEFKARQYGTGWYHSHVTSQYGDGVRGPMIIHGPATANYDIDMGTVMIDDLFPYTAAQMYEINAHIGPTGSSNYLLNGKNTKPDLSAGQHTMWTVTPGQKHLFRFINSASQNIFSVHFDQHTMTVIAVDYVPIVPYTTDWLNIGTGQRYDVIVEMNQPDGGYFLRAVTQTSCPSSCLNNGLGSANGIILYNGTAPTLPTSSYGNKTMADFNTCIDEPLASIVPYLPMPAGTSDAFMSTASTLPAGPVAMVATNDDGNVYRWFLNNGAIDVNFTQPTLQTLATGRNVSLFSNPVILSSKNEWVYFVIQNQFHAAHPMHLHGHDFSILGQGNAIFTADMVNTLNFDNPPRRDTCMLNGQVARGDPPGYTVIGFQTNNPGAWLMHCHIVWHVEGGLALQFIERPDDIEYSTYLDSDWQEECQALETWQSEGPGRVKLSSSSGLKARTYFDRVMSEHTANVIRRADKAGKRYLKSSVKRDMGKRARRPQEYYNPRQKS